MYWQILSKNVKWEKRNKRGDVKLYEVTFSVDGIIKKINISANDALQAQSVFTILVDKN